VSNKLSFSDYQSTFRKEHDSDRQNQNIITPCVFKEANSGEELKIPTKTSSRKEEDWSRQRECSPVAIPLAQVSKRKFLFGSQTSFAKKKGDLMHGTSLKNLIRTDTNSPSPKFNSTATFKKNVTNLVNNSDYCKKQAR